MAAHVGFARVVCASVPELPLQLHPLLDTPSTPPLRRAPRSCRYDNGVDYESNIYFALNRALRERKSDAAGFQLWQGFLYFLKRALDQLDRHSGVVYVAACDVAWCVCARDCVCLREEERERGEEPLERRFHCTRVQMHGTAAAQRCTQHDSVARAGRR